MDASKASPQALFGKPVRYEILEFQRPYVWDETQQWEPLWEDVSNLAEEYREKGTAPRHFMGAVVLQQRPHTSTGVEIRVVVDGQQRLTTIQLLLDAIQEVFEEGGQQDPATRLSRMVSNGDEYTGGERDRAFKIWPTVYDQDSFRRAMRNDLQTTGHENARIVRAHDFFKGKAESWLDEQPEIRRERAEALERVIRLHLEIVVIDLDENEDPNVIFEALNARGTPLRQYDLVKNMVLHKAGIRPDDEEQPEVVVGPWEFYDSWWEESVGPGWQARDRIDVFLNSWLTVRNRTEITARHEFTEFRKYIRADENPGMSMAAVADDIGRLAAIYRDIETGNKPEIATFLYRREVLRAGVLTPVLMWLISSGVPQHQVHTSLTVLESFLVRRMMCGYQARGYSQLFVGLLQDLDAFGASQAAKTVIGYLAKQEGSRYLWPDNQEFEDAFLTTPLYKTGVGRCRMVLEAIEEALITDWAEKQSVPRGLSIEHILPQGWRSNAQHWPLPLGAVDENRAERIRNSALHSIGNLTLVTQKLDSSLSNGSWQEKKQKLGDYANLFLNTDLLNHAPNVWDESAIVDRARRLFGAAIRVWPHADDIK